MPIQFAFCLFEFFPYGGLQRNMLAMALAAVQRKHDVDIYCGSWVGDKPQGLNVVELPVSGWSNAGRAKSFSRALKNTLDGSNYDFVVGFNKMPGLDLYYAADSCFAQKTYYERSFFHRLAPRSRTYLEFEKSIFNKSSRTHILEVSTKERPLYIAHYATPVERFHTLPPGISRTRVAPENSDEHRGISREQLGVTADQKILLALGSGFRTKGVDRSIEILHQLSDQYEMDALLLVVGEDKADNYRRLAERLNIADKVHFLGGRDDVPSLLLAADVLVHPAYKENTGNVLLEAMVAELPVVASDVCGYAHYINEANMGEVVLSPYDAASAIIQVKKVLDKPRAYWKKHAQSFSQTADIYSRPERAVDIMETLWSRKHNASTER